MSSFQFQQYVRILLYSAFGALGGTGLTVTEGYKSMIASGVGILATFVWTLYGTRLNALLAAAKAKTGIESIEIKVDPAIIPPYTITDNTPSGVVAKSS